LEDVGPDSAEHRHALQEVDPRFWHDDTSGLAVIMIFAGSVRKEERQTRRAAFDKLGPAYRVGQRRHLRANTMADKTSIKSTRVAKKAAAKRVAAKPALLSGGNPQVPKGYGDAPVQAYIAAMPGWKRDVGRRLDALIVRTVPNVRKAVKWNSPFYGIEGQGEDQVWFLSFHCFTNYVKVAFFRGASLRPVPPGASKQKDVRYLDIHEDEELDEAQLAAWVKQASLLPGEKM
jgi:hypothetical protein